MSPEAFSTLPEENTLPTPERNPEAELAELSQQLPNMDARYDALTQDALAGEKSEVISGSQEGVATLHENSELLQTVNEVLFDFENLEDSEGNLIDGYDVFSSYMRNASPEIQENFVDFDMGGLVYDTIVDTGKFPVNDFEFQAILTGQTQSDSVLQEDREGIETAETRTETAETIIATDIEGTETAEIRTETAEIESGVEIERFQGNLSVAKERREETQELKNTLIAFSEGVSDLNVSPELRGLLNQLESIDISVYDLSLEDFDNLSKEDFEAANGTLEEMISNFNNIDSTFQNISAHLNATREIEEVILPQARAAGNYEQVRKSLTTGGLNFESRIRAWELMENGPHTIKTLPPEQQIRASAALGTSVEGVASDADQSGNIFTLETDTGEEINYDVVSGERTLSVGDYSLSSQVEDTGDYQTPKLEYMRVEQETLPRLQKISKAAEAVSDAMFNSQEVDKIKSTLKESLGLTYFTELGLDGMQTAMELKSAIQEAYRENNTALEEARETYQTELEGLRDGHMAALERKDKKVKETLRFLESIGFTDIPQYITNQIIDTLNSNSGLRRQIGFTEKIDFENGQLGTDYTRDGESLDVEIPIIDKKKFAEIINRMIGVTDSEGKPPINVDAIGTTSVPVGDKSIFQGLLNQSGLLNVGGVGIAMNNLTQTEEN